MDIKTIFTQAIERQEQLRIKAAFRFDDETQEEFDAKVARRLKGMVIGIGNTYEYPRVKEICPIVGEIVIWEGLKISRRTADELDNIYVSRA